MIFLASVALFAATVFLFLYGVQLQRRGALPKWAQRDGVLHAAALAFTLISPLSLALMLAFAPSSKLAYDVAISLAAAVAVFAVAYYLAAHLAGGSGRGKGVRL